MAEILITGFEMPPKDDTYGLHLVIYPNGDVWIAYDDKPTGKAIEVPPHRRLIDEADLRDRAYKRQIRDRISFQDALALALMEAPIIIEASKERE